MNPSGAVEPAKNMIVPVGTLDTCKPTYSSIASCVT